MPHTLSWFRFSNVLKCPLSTNKVRTSIRKAGTQHRTLHTPKVQKETISWESHVLAGVGVCPRPLMQPGGGTLFSDERLSEISSGILPICPQKGSLNMEWPALSPRAWTRQPEPSFLVLAGVGAEKAPEVKMFINTQGPKRKEPVTYETAGEAVGFLLFSWCEWITSLIWRDSEVSSAISCDNIYFAGKGGGRYY